MKTLLIYLLISLMIFVIIFFPKNEIKHYAYLETQLNRSDAITEDMNHSILA